MNNIESLKNQAIAHQSAHAAVCPAIANGNLCFQGIEPKHFKGIIKGSQFRTATAAADACNSYHHDLGEIRSAFVKAVVAENQTTSFAALVSFNAVLKIQN